MALVARGLSDTETNRIHRRTDERGNFSGIGPGVTVRVQTWEDSRTQSHVAFTYDHRTTRDSEEMLFTARTGQVAHIVGSNEGSFPIDATRNQNRRPGWTPEIAEAELASRYTDVISSGPYPTRP